MTVLRNLLMASTYLTKLATEVTTYQYLIEKVDISNRIYITSNGDDTSGDGSKDNPYQTINYVRDNIINTQKGKTIILHAETYTVSWEEDYVHQWRIIGNSFADTDIIGAGAGTVIECLGSLGGGDSSFFGANGGSFNVWGVHFKRNGNGRTINHQCSICSNGGGSSTSTYPTTTMVFTNCIIEEVGSGYASLTYMGNANSYTFNNCLFIATWTTNYSGSSYLTLNDCALTNGPVYGSAILNNTIDQVAFDGLYMLSPEDNNQGVYSGYSGWAGPYYAKEPFSVVNTMSVNRTANTSAYTFTNVDFGATIPDIGNSKDIYYVFGSRGGNAVSSITIDGQVPELIARAQSTSSTFMTAEIWRLKNVRKTSGDIYFSLTGQNSTSLHEVFVVMNGEITDFTEVISTTLTTLSATLNISEGGAVFALNHCDSSGSSSVTWTGVTEIADFSGENNVRSAALETNLSSETGRFIQAATGYDSTGGNVLVAASISEASIPDSL